MFPEDNIVLHVDDVHCIISIVFFKELQNLKLDPCLIIILLLVLDDFKCNKFFELMVKALDCNTKGTFAEEALHFIPIPNMISHHNLVVSFMIVISIVMLTLGRTFNLLATHTNVVDLWIIEDLL